MAGERRQPPGDGAAEQIGRSLGRLVRKAHDAALEHQPEAEQMARRAVKVAKEAIDASRPAAERAATYVREHEDEIRKVGGVASEAIAWRVLPRPLRPLLGSVIGKLFRPKPPKQP